MRIWCSLISSHLFIFVVIYLCASLIREHQHAVDRFDEWNKLRAKAKENCKGKLPEGFDASAPAPPPPPPEDVDIADLSMDLKAISLEPEMSLGELDESGIERVPMADPGMDVSGFMYSGANVGVVY